MRQDKVHSSYMKAAQAAEDLQEDAEAMQAGMEEGASPAEDGAQEAQEACAPQESPDVEARIEARVKAGLEDMRLRSAAEMENFKKRLQREHQEQMRYAAEKVLSDLLPTLDNLDLALQYGSKNEACKDMLQGVEMTRKLLMDAVGRHGLTALAEEGEAFDPVVHEAVGFDSRPELAPGSVARVLQRGYKLGDRLLRPAKVMINQ